MMISVLCIYYISSFGVETFRMKFLYVKLNNRLLFFSLMIEVICIYIKNEFEIILGNSYIYFEFSHRNR